jgi:hypothetical protein
MARTMRPMAIDIPTMAPVEILNAPWFEPSAPGELGFAVDPTPPSGTPTPSCADIVGKAGSVCVGVGEEVEEACGRARTTEGRSKRHLYK